MKYVFDIKIAEKYGVEEAVLLQNLIFWISKNKKENRHQHYGRYWTFNSAKSFKLIFPFWSERKIHRLLASLVKRKVLLKGNYNRHRYDRTGWYSFVDENEFLTEDPLEGRVPIDNVWHASSENDKSISEVCENDNHNVVIPNQESVDTIPDVIRDGTKDETTTSTRAAVDYLRSSWKRTIYPLEEKTIKALVDQYGLEKVMYAVDQSVIYNASKIAYIQGVLTKQSVGALRGNSNVQAIDNYIGKLKEEK